MALNHILCRIFGLRNDERRIEFERASSSSAFESIVMKNVQIIDGADNCSYDIFSFTDDQFKMIFPKAMNENKRSQKVMQKIGMKFQTNYIEDEFPARDKNAVKYQILSAEWKTQG